MSRNRYAGPKLPGFILDQVQKSPDPRFHQTSAGRKARRKAERLQKKQAGKGQQHNGRSRQNLRSDNEDDGGDDEPTPPPPKKVTAVVSKEPVKQPKSILKPSKPAPAPPAPMKDAREDLTVSRRAAKEGLEDEDAEIAALEKKLGIKGRKSKALADDGLDWIAGEASDSGSDGEGRGTKRKRPEDERWLRDKRLKASGAEELVDSVSEDEDEDDVLGNPFSDDEVDGDDFSGFEQSADEDATDHEPAQAIAPTKAKQKENPYLPPITPTQAPGKYIPPSLRAQPDGEDEVLKQLRRQIQGLLNRLAESNLLSIVRSLEDAYAKNARQHVTSTLVDLLITLVADASVLSDSFLVLHAAFAGAVYRLIGTDFGAQLLERVVEGISPHLEDEEGKQALNLLAFLSNLYSFGVVGSPILFSYMRLLLSELREKNTELLLRIIRNCGQALRQDDPSALKDVVLLLQRQVAKQGEENVSVRTKFMIETINDLKNNRLKATNTMAAEQTARLKKVLASLHSSRSLKSTEPLSVTLSDIRDTEKRGKWWLVGASYHDQQPAKLPTTATDNSAPASDPGDEDETGPNLHALARQQGMNTAVRRAIFTTLLSSVDYTHAHMALLKLHLRNKQQLEIPRVLVHCVRAEESYNPFYALVATKFVGDRALRKGFEFGVWDFFRTMEEDGDDGEPGVRVREIVNVAKFTAALVVEGGLRMGVLSKLHFTPSLDRNASMFVEVILTTVFVLAKRPVGKKKVKEQEFETKVREIFTQVVGDAVLIRGLREVVEGSVVKAELATGEREKRVVSRGCEVALGALEEGARKVVAMDDESEDEM